MQLLICGESEFRHAGVVHTNLLVPVVMKYFPLGGWAAFSIDENVSQQSCTRNFAKRFFKRFDTERSPEELTSLQLLFCPSAD